MVFEFVTILFEKTCNFMHNGAKQAGEEEWLIRGDINFTNEIIF